MCDEERGEGWESFGVRCAMRRGEREWRSREWGKRRGERVLECDEERSDLL